MRLDTLTHEPEVDDVDRASAELRKAGAGQGDFLLAVGGGAAIDLAKAIAAMATNTESPTIKDYLEGVGKGLKITAEPLPVLAMPTTAGTGCEATKNAVISCYDPAFKKSIRDERIVPRIALVDPELTVSVPTADHGREWHGRDHPTFRELHFAQSPATHTGSRRARFDRCFAGDP